MRKQRKEKVILEYSTLDPVKEVNDVDSPILDQIEHDVAEDQEVAKGKEPRQVCDFCGKSLMDMGLPGSSTKERRKYCSERCRSRAQRGLTAVRLDIPLSKRYKSRLKFSSPLYFD